MVVVKGSKRVLPIGFVMVGWIWIVPFGVGWIWIDQKSVTKNGEGLDYVLIKQFNGPVRHVTSVEITMTRNQFMYFNLEDKVPLEEWSVLRA